MTEHQADNAPNKKDNILKVASLFSGCGGMDLGFIGGISHLGVYYEHLPYQVVWANDIDKDAVSTYKANQKYFGTGHYVAGDIFDQDPHSVPCFDVLIAGFPCQPFSNAGKRLGIKDERGTLFQELIKFLKAKKPKAFVLENVKGILSTKMADGTPVTEEIRKNLGNFVCDSGEEVSYIIPPAKLLKSNDYGVPQQRQRVFIIGTRKDIKTEEFDFEILKNFVKTASMERRALRAVLSDLSPDLPDANTTWHLSPQAANLVPMIKRSWKDIPYDLLPPRFQRIRDQSKRYRSPNFYRRFALEEINGTITAAAQPENCGIIHPEENRRFTVREIARIQSLPDYFIFNATTVAGKYRLIGNAVPPVMAWVIASALYCHIANDNPSDSKNSSCEESQALTGVK